MLTGCEHDINIVEYLVIMLTRNDIISTWCFTKKNPKTAMVHDLIIKTS
jgi:hypothetical protein